ncbi:MAG: MMPL family transporter, partial [Oscillospiraceae bacterium]|nr:MMPL family transporter [Oscillospiraceae bacterium]
NLRQQVNMGVEQLRGEHWNRLVFTVDLPADSPESYDLVEKLRGIAEAEYGSGNVLLVGDITSARDLSASFESDSLLISFLTIGFVLTILLVTFRTVAGSLLLVFAIQGSIWINFSFPYLQGQSPSFVTYMIVSAIQMGATIDYAIVLMNRYLVMRETLEKKPAMIEALNQSFPTVLTSGSILTLAGLIISWRVTDVYVGHIGLAVGRGALISAILVLTVLPQLLVFCDRLIFRTRFSIDLAGGDGMSQKNS